MIANTIHLLEEVFLEVLVDVEGFSADVSDFFFLVLDFICLFVALDDLCLDI